MTAVKQTAVEIAIRRLGRIHARAFVANLGHSQTNCLAASQDELPPLIPS
jgi:hypothetical protein